MKNVTQIRPDLKEVDRPTLVVGDSVYYGHPEDGQPTHGTVTAVGRDGFTTDSDGATHQVVWQSYLGSRRRAERRLIVHDRGEDGSIMEDESGRKVFVRGSLEDHTEEEQGKNQPNPLTKSDIEAIISAFVPDRTQAAQTDPLLVKAQIVRELSHAGFEPMADYVRDTFGDNFVYRQPPLANEQTGPYNESLERLSASMAAQFQGMAAAISLLAERLADSDSLQKSMLAALTEARKPMDINMVVTMPESKPKAMRGVRGADGSITFMPVKDEA